MSHTIVTCGDVNGIGLRCLAGALKVNPSLASNLTLVIDRGVLDQAQTKYSIHLPIEIHGIYSPCSITPGQPSAAASRLAILSLETAFSMAVHDPSYGVTTLPISKHALQSAGWKYPGQTEMAEDVSEGTSLMVMHHHDLRIAVNTVHIPLNLVAASITAASTMSNLQTLHNYLVADLGILSPRIAVLGLNPHAGEHGSIGNEEVTTITPAIQQAVAVGIAAEGPFPADGFFGFGAYQQYHGILAMYHDQGLIPAKILSKGAGVNVTAGLSIVRTSPDHGTGYDKVLTDDVDSTSVLQAIQLCRSIVNQRSLH